MSIVKNHHPAEGDGGIAGFLEALTALSREHGIAVLGCGCCGSPFLGRLADDERGGCYVVGRNDEDRPNEDLSWEARP